MRTFLDVVFPALGLCVLVTGLAWRFTTPSEPDASSSTHQHDSSDRYLGWSEGEMEAARSGLEILYWNVLNEIADARLQAGDGFARTYASGEDPPESPAVRPVDWTGGIVYRRARVVEAGTEVTSIDIPLEDADALFELWHEIQWLRLRLGTESPLESHHMGDS